MNACPVFAVACCLLMVSCASDPNRQIGIPLPHFSTIAIMTPEDIVMIEGADSRGEKAEEATTAAAAAGTGGAMIGAVVCGPGWAICAASAAALSAFGGALEGVPLIFEGVSKEDSIYIEEQLTRLREERNFQMELADGVIESLPTAVLAGPEEASAQAVIRVNTVEFHEEDKKEVYLAVRGIVIVVAKGDGGKLMESQREISAFSDRHGMKHWLDRNKDIFESSADQCMEQLISKATALILEHSTIAVGETQSYF